MPTVDVSIIVVTWNARELVDRCLAAATGPGVDGVTSEVIVVDNASTDDTVEHVRRSWPGVRIVETGVNGGMAAGNNAGMRVARGRALLLLNSDCFLDAGAARALVDRLDAGLDGRALSVVVPRLRNEDGTLQRSVRGFPTPWRLATEFLFVRRLAPRSRWANALYGSGFPHDEARIIEWATGACMLVARDALDEVGPMDEGYVMYGEEVDWIRRMADAGRSCAFEPAAGAIHLGGGSSRRVWGAMYALQVANHVRYQQLRAGPRAARRTRRIIVVGLAARIAIAWVSGLATRRRALSRDRIQVLAGAMRRVRG